MIEYIEEFISYSHLHVGESRKSVVYLNYMLELTQTEYDIICLLVQRAGTPISAEKIARALNISSGSHGVACHISLINKKAFAIGERKLILNSSKIGYFLNKQM